MKTSKSEIKAAFSRLYNEHKCPGIFVITSTKPITMMFIPQEHIPKAFPKDKDILLYCVGKTKKLCVFAIDDNQELKPMGFMPIERLESNMVQDN